MVEKELGAGLVMMSGGGSAVAGTWIVALAILVTFTFTMMTDINFLL